MPSDGWFVKPEYGVDIKSYTLWYTYTGSSALSPSKCREALSPLGSHYSIRVNSMWLWRGLGRRQNRYSFYIHKDSTDTLAILKYTLVASSFLWHVDGGTGVA